MNNNRGNNRRRGRGNNRQQGGGQQLNRIDSRARGNAPQLLEKYRKLAHDAHLNGDRVTEEYNLQFADHYFRVIADQRQRQDEARQPRSDRWQEGGEGERFESDGGGEYGGEGEYQSSPYNYGERRERENAPVKDEREAAPPAEPSRATAEDERNGSAAVYEPVENPFIRDNRAPRGVKPRRTRRETGQDEPAQAQRRDQVQSENQAQDEDQAVPEARPRARPQTRQRRAAEDAAPPQLDLAVLPPAIAAREEGAEPEAEAKPKRRVTRRKPADDEASEALKAAS